MIELVKNLYDPSERRHISRTKFQLSLLQIFFKNNRCSPEIYQNIIKNFFFTKIISLLFWRSKNIWPINILFLYFKFELQGLFQQSELEIPLNVSHLKASISPVIFIKLCKLRVISKFYSIEFLFINTVILFWIL